MEMLCCMCMTQACLAQGHSISTAKRYYRSAQPNYSSKYINEINYEINANHYTLPMILQAITTR